MRGVWIVSAVITSACSFTPGVVPSGDASGIDGAPVDIAIPSGWSTPVELTELSDSAGADDPSLTNDLLEIYFGSRRSGNVGMSGAEDIWFATRDSVTEPFGPPQNASSLNTAFSETTMKITGDGLTIFFSSNRVGNDYDVYVSTRPNRDPQTAWSTPMRVAELSSNVSFEWAPYAQSNLLQIVFCSGPTEAAEALYVSERANTSAMWSPPARLDELDEINISECDPMIPHPRALYYASDYLNTDGTFDIYRAARNSAADPYGSRTPISDINLPGVNDRDPWVSADERTMVFASDRNGVNDAIYISTR